MLLELTKRQELISMFSDIYKDVNGIRPRGHNFDAYTDQELDTEISRMFEQANEQADEEKLFEAKKVEEFKAMIQRYISEFGASDEEEALKWYLDGSGEKFYSPQCVEQLIWNEGILFTDYGKAIISKLCKLATYIG